MPWVRFTQDYDWHVSPRAMIAYKAGGRYLVSQACATKVIAMGKANTAERPQPKPTKDHADARR